jgi:hypothetical protein
VVQDILPKFILKMGAIGLPPALKAKYEASHNYQKEIIKLVNYHLTIINKIFI